jgi:hypothetical protein
VTVTKARVRVLSHCPLASGPSSEIDGGIGSSIVTSTVWACIVAPGRHWAALQTTSCSTRVVPSGAAKVIGHPRLSQPVASQYAPPGSPKTKA